MSVPNQRDELAALIERFDASWNKATGDWSTLSREYLDDLAAELLLAGYTRRVGAVDDGEDVVHVETDAVRTLGDIVRRYRFHSAQIVWSKDERDAYALLDVLRETWAAAQRALSQDSSQTPDNPEPKVGDRVQFDGDVAGEIGTVLARNAEGKYRVRWDDKIGDEEWWLAGELIVLCSECGCKPQDFGIGCGCTPAAEVSSQTGDQTR